MTEYPPTDAEPIVPELDEHAAAEAALARLEDRSGAFTSYAIARDFLELSEIFAGSFERVKDEDWNRRTDRRADGWTMRQALAHTTAAAELFNQVILTGLEGRPVVIPGFVSRDQLKEINQAAIEARTEQSVPELITAFLAALHAAARIAAPLAADQLGRIVPVPFYGTAPTVAELFGCSLAHAGIIHGAQLAVARSRPIWIFFQPGMMRRQLTRLFHLLGLVYWPERGGDLHATIGVNVAGQGGGSWYVRVGPDGGQGKIGRARTTDVTFSFASADLLCRVLTYQTRPWRHLVLRRIRINGNLGLARRIPQLFAPT